MIEHTFNASSSVFSTIVNTVSNFTDFMPWLVNNTRYSASSSPPQKCVIYCANFEYARVFYTIYILCLMSFFVFFTRKMCGYYQRYVFRRRLQREIDNMFKSTNFRCLVTGYYDKENVTNEREDDVNEDEVNEEEGSEYNESDEDCDSDEDDGWRYKLNEDFTECDITKYNLRPRSNVNYSEV